MFKIILVVYSRSFAKTKWLSQIAVITVEPANGIFLLLGAILYTDSEHGEWMQVGWADITKMRRTSCLSYTMWLFPNPGISASVRDMFDRESTLKNSKYCNRKATPCMTDNWLASSWLYWPMPVPRPSAIQNQCIMLFNISSSTYTVLNWQWSMITYTYHLHLQEE